VRGEARDFVTDNGRPSGGLGYLCVDTGRKADLWDADPNGRYRFTNSG
jgi:hypothetical protein